VAQLAIVAAMFHLFTHAFFKALLFLASGSVMHAMGDVIDMRRFRGLRHRLPVTCWTFAVGGLALSGIPPLSGFFSKDEILLAIKSASHESHRSGWIYMTVYWLAVLTALMTAFYTGRAFFMTFFGDEKLPSPDDPEAPMIAPTIAHGHDDHAHGHDDHGHAHEIGHESPPIMAYPLIALAGFTILFGLICVVSWPFIGPTKWFEGHLEGTFRFEDLGHAVHGFDWATAFVGTLAGLIGLGASYRLYARPSPIPARLAQRFRPLYDASLNKFYIDEIYGWIVLKPLRLFAVVSEFLDMYLVHGIVEGISRLPKLFGRDVLAPYQNGLIQFYAAVSALGVAGLFLILLLYS
jgi:NADH-quinone oxidoreductase subunit L